MRLRRIVAVVAVVVVAVAVVDRCHRNRVSEWETRVERVQERVRSERARTAEAVIEAASAAARADSLADALRNRPVIRELELRVVEATPDSLRDHPAVVVRDSLIAEQREEIAGWVEAYEGQKERGDILAEALADAEESRDSLALVLDERPGKRPWYVPRLGVGPFLGACADGSVCAGGGVSLTWEIRF